VAGSSEVVVVSVGSSVTVGSLVVLVVLVVVLVVSSGTVVLVSVAVVVSVGHSSGRSVQTGSGSVGGAPRPAGVQAVTKSSVAVADGSEVVDVLDSAVVATHGVVGWAWAACCPRTIRPVPMSAAVASAAVRWMVVTTCPPGRELSEVLRSPEGRLLPSAGARV
jgi:hypothetical protein